MNQMFPRGICVFNDASDENPMTYDYKKVCILKN